MKLLVLDGNSIFNRAFYGIKLLTTKDGFYTNAIYGFLTMLNKVKDEVNPDAIAIAFDMKAPTFRHDSYKEYKANRKGMPEELAVQFPVLKELLSYMGYRLVEKEGFEADDILGTLAKACEDSDNECIIATGDRDSLQLVSDKVSVRIASTKFGRPEVTLYDENKIKEVYGVSPKQLIDIKAIQGDASDNIPGVAGIGEKGAGELIRKFGSLEYIYDNIDTIDVKDGIRKKLIDSKENAFLSKYLGTIVKNAPVDLSIEDYIPNEMNRKEVSRLMTKLEMFSLMNKMGINHTIEDEENSKQESDFKKYSVVLNEKLEILQKLMEKCSKVDFLVEYKEGQVYVLSFLIEDTIYIITDINKYMGFIKSIMENKKIAKRTHNVKPFFEVMQNLDINLSNVIMDTILAAYLLNPSSKNYDLETIFQEYDVKKMCVICEDNNYNDIAEKTAMFQDLCERINVKINENNQKSLLENIEIPLAQVLADMENIGFLVDREGIKKYGESLDQELREIQNEIYKYVGKEFNINSPKQLGTILFEDMGLPKGKKTKSGYSTNAEVLENIRKYHPVVDLILQYRAISKLKNTYCDGLLKVIGSDSRLHSRFNQIETRTGRISSLEPNLQNIPVRTEKGKELRRFFRAKDGCILVDADYSQIELRILAHISNDKNMIDAFKDNLDIHTITASQVFGMPENMVTPILRSRAKAVNFGIVYGIGAFSLAKDIGVTRKDAESYINSYLAHYSGVDKYMHETIEKAKKNKYVETIFGRRRYLPELSSSNFMLRSFGERVARNMPIQGSAADIIKIAMINVRNRLKNENLNAKLILQVHDELIVESPENEANIVAEILKEEMENAVTLRVPLIADANMGKTWYETKL